MTIFNFADEEALGLVISVDTSTVIVKVEDRERLRRLQVNRLAVLQSSRPGQYLVGIIQKITRTADRNSDGIAAEELDATDGDEGELNLVRVVLIGTFLDSDGAKRNVFRRTLESVPEIDARCFAAEGGRLTEFMRVISYVDGDGPKLSLGAYSLDHDAEAFLNGNKFFQRHAIIVGSTGSGKSWTTARLLEQIAELPQANAIVFDMHGEYGSLDVPGTRHLRVAGPGDIERGEGMQGGVLFLPYWLLGYEALVTMLVDRTDQNAPNQAMVVSRSIVAAKKSLLEQLGRVDLLEQFTIDSPIPFDIDSVQAELERLNSEMVPGARGDKQGDFFGKLSRLIARLDAKRSDRRLGFMFRPPTEALTLDWLDRLVGVLLAGSADAEAGGGVKVIDFSEVPSDVLPLVVSLVARLAFSVQQWRRIASRHPIALICDEAHLYIPDRASSDSADGVSVEIFERIAKEGRKYGVGLVVISQRPSEVNRTVLSQCNNLVAMRLTNGDDQAVVRRLLPDSLGGFGDILPVLDTGEALVVGDASLLPSRIRIARPKAEPRSGTIDFWDRWSDATKVAGLDEATNAWRRQSLS